MGWVSHRTTNFLLWTLICLSLPCVHGSKLNVPRVLLPYSSSPPKFSLFADTGCYVWSTTRPDLISVLQLGDGKGDCYREADIQAVPRSGVKASAMVLAEDPVSGLTLRADVILDHIHGLRIVTKTHELYLEETPEKFEV